MREAIQRSLETSRDISEGPATVFCVQPFTSVERDNGERLGRLLARVMADHSLLVATAPAFVSAFNEHSNLEQGTPSV